MSPWLHALLLEGCGDKSYLLEPYNRASNIVTTEDRSFVLEDNLYLGATERVKMVCFALN